MRSIRAVLVDEFQDTDDTIQYRIFKRLFIESERKKGTGLLRGLRGDPKQSICHSSGARISGRI